MLYNRYGQNGAGAVGGVGRRNPRMVFDPTYVPSSQIAGQSVSPADDYIAIQVDTTGLSGMTKIVLFDGGQGYQLSTGYVMPGGAVITAKSGASYQFILNDLVHNSLDIHRIQMRVFSTDSGIDSEEIALAQFDNQLSLYEASKGGEVKLIKTINPGKGLHEMQYKTNINSFNENLFLSNRHAIVYLQEPDIKLNWGFYVRGEAGRTI